MSNPNTDENVNLPIWYPHIRQKPVYHANEEALAFCIDGIARAVQFVGAGAFIGTALINIAADNAGCPTEPPEGETRVPDCNERVYGIKPSSLLTTYTMVIGVSSTFLLPLLGAIVDYTPHRLLSGRIASVLYVLLMVPQLAISHETWVMTAILQVLISVVGWAQTAITYAYLPELTDDEVILNDYTKSYTMFFFSCMVVYLAVVIGAVNAMGYQGNDIATARLAISISLVVNILFLPVAWGRLFKQRPPMHKLREDQTLWTAGFVQLYSTSVNISRNFRALKWFLLAIACSDAGMQATGTISLSYWTDQLDYSVEESGIAILIILLSSVPGAVVANRVNRRFDPCKSSMAALIVHIITTAVYSVLVSDPSHKLASNLLCFGWGFAIGWKWTSDRLLASFIIPEGQDAELMGVFLFAGQCLTWIPSLVYIIINESSVSPRYGVASLVIWFILSYICYLLMGSYERARFESGRGVERKTENDGNEDLRTIPNQHPDPPADT